MKMQLLSVFPFIKKKLLISGEKNADVSRTQGVCHVVYIFFRFLFVKV